MWWTGRTLARRKPGWTCCSSRRAWRCRAAHLRGELLARSAAARAAAPAAITAVVAAVAGDFTCQSLLPSPLGLPTLRGFQAAQGEVARRWLAERTSW